MSPQERSLRAKLAAHTLHSQRDPQETTARARATFLNRFEQQVDPEGTLSPEERARRAEHARRAYFARLSLRSARVRRERKEASHAAA